MRTLSFVHKIIVPFPGKIIPNAITFGDVDNDGRGELVIGNVEGLLYIIKGRSTKPWLIFDSMGSITVVRFMKISRTGPNYLCVITAEGSLFICNSNRLREGLEVAQKQSPDDAVKTIFGEPHPVNINIRSAVCADFDGDGRNELAVGRTDRKVHFYRLIINEAGDVVKIQEYARQNFFQQIDGMSANLNSADGSMELLVAQSAGSYARVDSQNQVHYVKASVGVGQDHGVVASGIIGGVDFVGRGISRDSFDQELHGMIPGMVKGRTSSIRSPRKGRGRRHSSRNSAPGTPSRLEMPDITERSERDTDEIRDGVVSPTSKDDEMGARDKHTDDALKTSGSADLTPAAPTRQSRTHEDRLRNLIATATSDGSIRLIKDGEDIWELQVDHQLFGMQKFDFLGDDRDEIVAVSWDGMTYIIDHDKEGIRFKFPQNIAAFAAGHYAMSDNVTESATSTGNGPAEDGAHHPKTDSQALACNEPCLAYLTFSDEIHIYYQLEITHLKSVDLFKVMHREVEEYQEEIATSKLQQGDAKAEKNELAHFFAMCLDNTIEVQYLEHKTALMRVQLAEMRKRIAREQDPNHRQRTRPSLALRHSALRPTSASATGVSESPSLVPARSDYSGDETIDPEYLPDLSVSQLTVGDVAAMQLPPARTRSGSLTSAPDDLLADGQSLDGLTPDNMRGSL
eukprot:Clim_evm50s229 gene=Clim_evmTU50s229